MAGTWCGGHVIDGSPAICHALRVAIKLGEHIPQASRDLVAAALLHDSPYFAPVERDLEATLADRVGIDVARIVLTLRREHADMTVPNDWQTLAVSVADKIVSVGSVLRRARVAPDKGAYWRARDPFVGRMPYLRLFLAEACQLPDGMVTELGNLLWMVELDIETYS